MEHWFALEKDSRLEKNENYKYPGFLSKTAVDKGGILIMTSSTNWEASYKLQV